MQTSFSRLLLRYLIFVGIPFLISKRIQKFLEDKIDPEIKAKLNEELKKFPDIENISESSKNGLNNRGGASPLLFWFYKIVVQDFAIKVTIAGAVGSTIWGKNADTAAVALVKYGAAIISAPGTKFIKFVKKIRGIEHHEQDIREIILDKNLGIQEKMELLKIKIEQTLKTLKGTRKIKFILFVISTLLFFFGAGKIVGPGNFVVFSSLLERLRALLGDEGIEDDLKNALIEVYQEYNAPIPSELLPEEIKKIIKSLE